MDLSTILFILFWTMTIIASILLYLYKSYRKAYEFEIKKDKMSTDMFLNEISRYAAKVLAQDFLIQKLNDSILILRNNKKDNPEDSI